MLHTPCSHRPEQQRRADAREHDEGRGTHLGTGRDVVGDEGGNGQQSRHDPADRDDPRAAPLRAKNLSNLPPAMIVAAEFDPLRDEGEAYAAGLRDAGVEVEAIRYNGQIHHFFTMPAMLDDARHAIDRAAAALRTALA